MRKFLLITVLIILSPAVLTAQERKSITMDDLSPSPVQSRSGFSPKEEERVWQRLMYEKRLEVFYLQLRSSLDERNLNLKIELKKREKELALLLSEGRKREYRSEQSLEIDYRERYVKLRLEMIKEEKAHPPQPIRPLEEKIFVEARKPRKGSRINAPVLETKVIERPLTKLERLVLQLEELAEEGRRLGVAPGIFRD